MPKSKGLAPEITSGLWSVGVRMPSHPVSLRLIALAGMDMICSLYPWACLSDASQMPLSQLMIFESFVIVWACSVRDWERVCDGVERASCNALVASTSLSPWLLYWRCSYLLIILLSCGVPDVPVAAPSANISGRPSPTMAAHVMADLSDRIPLVVNGGPCSVGVESTVVAVHMNPPQILRPGGNIW